MISGSNTELTLINAEINLASPESIRPRQIIDAPCTYYICSDHHLLRRGYVHHDFRRTDSTGLGAGYLCQRRWKAYWITSLLAPTWFVLGAVLEQDAEAAVELNNQLIGLGAAILCLTRDISTSLLLLWNDFLNAKIQTSVSATMNS